MGIRLDWEIEAEQEHRQQSAGEDPESNRARRRARLRFFLVFFVLLALIGGAPPAGEAKRTLAKIEANVVEAAAQGVDLLAFPEEALVGASTCDACRAEAGPCDLHVEEAQTVLVTTAKELAARGEVFIPDGKDDDVIY